MNSKEFERRCEELNSLAESIAKDKRPAYSMNKGSDVTANFKRAASAVGITPLQAWGTHMEKQVSGIMTYIKTGAESEPVETRFADVMNYLYLGFALLYEKEGKEVNAMSEQDLEDFAQQINRED